MSDECIHGFDDGFCAVCSPPAVPESAVKTRPAKARSAPNPRTSSTRKPTHPVTRRTAPGAVSGPTKLTHTGDVAEQRLYHVTHVDNLDSIIESGGLLADTAGAVPTIDVASPEVRQARRETAIPGQTATVADYVPFYLSPDANLWDTVRTRGIDPRISTGAQTLAARDFVVVVTVVKDIFVSCADSTDAVPYSVTDGDAALSITRFGTGPTGTEKMLRSLRTEDGSGSILNAEFLVKDALPFELVTLIGVCNERVRDEVKAKLKRAGYRARVAVYPPWFQAVEVESA